MKLIQQNPTKFFESYELIKIIFYNYFPLSLFYLKHHINFIDKNGRKPQIAKIHNHNRINSGKRIKKFTTLLDLSFLSRSHAVSRAETVRRQS